MDKKKEKKTYNCSAADLASHVLNCALPQDISWKDLREVGTNLIEIAYVMRTEHYNDK